MKLANHWDNLTAKLRDFLEENPRPIMAVSVFLFVVGAVYLLGIKNNQVFTISNTESFYTWEAMEEDRQKRNLEKMNYSFDRLMELGNEMYDQGNIDGAVNHFFYAKSLFPSRMAPRIKLCQSYLFMCESEDSSCSEARKEIYFASKYVEASDLDSRQLLDEMIEKFSMDTLLYLPEHVALSTIFDFESESL